jgi:hypothetical protein
VRKAIVTLTLYLGIGVALATLYRHRHPATAFVTKGYDFNWRTATYTDRSGPDPLKAALCIAAWPVCVFIYLGEEIVRQ